MFGEKERRIRYLEGEVRYLKDALYSVERRLYQIADACGLKWELPKEGRYVKVEGEKP